ncbi:hypothetical protein BGX21_011104 [Mortierella sp. AD011]|nr:hypothetical protein BGX20_011112 [Mortierella sp. AD010]KAF9392043.1 hypothetical protein BGX21_011104 [Mortierella sp. AD011]
MALAAAAAAVAAIATTSNTSTESHTPDPFTDPNPPKDGARQTAAKVVALPLAAVGGAIAEATRKIGELVSGHSTKIDTSHKHDDN